MAAPIHRRALGPVPALLTVVTGLLFLLSTPPAAQAQFFQRQASSEPVPEVTRVFAIENARIVQAPGRVIERGTVVVRNGLIVAVGEDVAIPYDAEHIDGDSLTVYAGFIDGLSHAGIPAPKRENQQRPTVDDRGHPPDDVAGITPQADAFTLLDPSDKSVAAMRNEGFTTAHTYPYGRMLPGQGAVIQLAGDDANDMVLDGEASMVASFQGAPGVYPSTDMAVMAKWRQLYREAQRRKRIESLYEDNPAGIERPPFDPVHQAFYPVIDGDEPVFFLTEGREGALQVYRALTLQETLGFPIVLVGLNQAFQVVDVLKDAHVPLFLTLNLPAEEKAARGGRGGRGRGGRSADSTAVDTTKAATPMEPRVKYDPDFRVHSYADTEAEAKNLNARKALARKDYEKNAALLSDAGLRFGFASLDAKAGDIRSNLRKMIAAGLSEDAALSALTVDAATMLGLDRMLGSIDDGKIANLVVTRGSYFDEYGKIEYVFVDGKKFDVEAPSAPAPAGDRLTAAGEWSYTVTTDNGTVSGTLSISGSPGALSGSITNEMLVGASTLENVVLNGQTLKFDFDGGEYGRISATLEIAANELSGSFSVPGVGDVPVSGSRAPTASNATPE